MSITIKQANKEVTAWAKDIIFEREKERVMKLIVNCPESDMDMYLQTVRIKLNEGYISGHDSQDKNWKMEEK